jgi:hypothetical protein
MMVGALVVALGAISSKIVQSINNSEKQARVSQSLQALQTNLTILLNTPSIYTNCSTVGANPTCQISPSTYAAVAGTTGDPSIDILYRRTLPFAECGGDACGLKAAIISPAPGVAANVVQVRIVYEGADLTVSPRNLSITIPELAYRITSINCSDAEFFVGVDAVGNPICSHIFSNCPDGMHFAGFGAPPAGQPYTTDPTQICQNNKPATVPSALCPSGTHAVAQSGGPIGIYVACLVPSSTTANCAANEVATQISWNLSNRMAPAVVCFERKGL